MTASQLHSEVVKMLVFFYLGFLVWELKRADSFSFHLTRKVARWCALFCAREACFDVSHWKSIRFLFLLLHQLVLVWGKERRSETETGI